MMISFPWRASAPLLVAGLFYLASSAIWLDWPVAGLGFWLIVVAAVGGFAGPVGVWAVGALAGGLAFLVTAPSSPGCAGQRPSSPGCASHER